MDKKGKPAYSVEFRAEAEVVKLRRALAETQMERDILKKATATFARESQKRSRI